MNRRSFLALLGLAPLTAGIKALPVLAPALATGRELAVRWYGAAVPWLTDDPVSRAILRDIEASMQRTLAFQAAESFRGDSITFTRIPQIEEDDDA